MVRHLTPEEYDSFVSEKTAAAIHFDAAWDAGYRPVTREQMLKAEATLSDFANFGEIDVDQEIPLARSLNLVGIPAVAYYLRGELVAMLIGHAQNVRGRLERLLRGEPIGVDDGFNGI